MKAAVLHEIGGPLAVEDMPEPDPAEGQSLVEVRASGINFADVLIRLGHYPQPPPLPAVLGNEISGDLDGRRVLALRAGTRRWLCGAGRRRRRVGVRPAAAGELRRGSLVPDDVPDGLAARSSGRRTSGPARTCS